MANEIKALTPTLKWLSDLLAFFQVEAIKIPTKYRDKVLEVKKLLNDDPSGLTNTVLDFSINCALVDYRIECDNPNLVKILNNWLKSINQDLRGKIPTGLNSLAKEYFRERWKGSSNLLLRTYWYEVDGLMLPTMLHFIDGEDIKVKSKSEDNIVRLGDEKYYLRVGQQEKNDIPLPKDKNELIFVQKPYESWGIREPIPYLIKRGVYRNSKFLQLLSSKGENIIAKALEYLFVLKKGTERLAIDGNITYDENDLKKANQDLADLVNKKKTEEGFPSYTTNFDTEMEHLIPDYSKAINDTIYSPIEKRILAGLGLIDIVQGAGSTRRESVLNPKPLVGEINQGISDFKSLLTDIILTIIEQNKVAHPKWMKAKIEIQASPISAFMDDKFRAMLRSAYDRGTISKRTWVEIGCELDFDLEIDRRKQEKEDGLEEVMYAPVIQNQEQQGDETSPDKKSIEKKNFNQSWEESKLLSPVTGMICLKCEYMGDLSEFLDTLKQSKIYNKTVSVCPGCSEELQEEDVSFASYEESKIVKRKDGWHVISEKTGKNLGGPYATRKEAVKRLQQVEFFKHQGSEDNENEKED